MPTNTLDLLAGIPYEWDTTSYDSLIFITDITGLYLTNSSGQQANLTIRGLYNP